MNPIFQALNSGYNPSQVLGFLSKAFPQLAPQIKKAKYAGYPAEKILGFLSKTVRDDIHPGMSETEIHSANKRHDANLTKTGLKAAAMTVAAPIAGQVVGNAIQRALPSSLQSGAPGLPGTTPSTIQNVPGSNVSTLGAPLPQGQAGNNVLQSQQPPIPGQSPATPTNISQPPIPTQPINAQRDIKKSFDILKNIGEEGRVKNLLQGGLETKDVAGVLRKLLPKDKLQALESYEGGLESVIDDFSLSMQDMQSEQTPEVINEEPLSIEPTAEEIPIQEEVKTPIQANQIVSTPSGVGEVKAIRNGKAIVEIDGKKHQVNEDEIESSLYSDDEIADAYEDLMSKIPEEQRSGFISWAGYDEDTHTLGFIPRSGKYEEIHNITPEEAKMIKEGKGVARTTGANTEGLWVAGEETRGGIISQIIHDRKKLRKAEEEKQGKLFDLPKKEKEDKGMKPIFDELAYARDKSREREKAKKIKEREAKKREKDEAKKRKKQA